MVLMLVEKLFVYVLLPVLTLTEIIFPICTGKPIFPLIRGRKNQNKE